MTTGEGGIALTCNPALDEKMRVLRDHGMSREMRYYHTHLGFNYRMTNMQAAVGLAQLETLDKIIELRDLQNDRYLSLLSDVDELQFRPKTAACRFVHWLFTVTLPSNQLRNELIRFLGTKGIDSRPMINPVSHADHYRKHFKDTDFPVSIDISSRSIHLPSSTGLTQTQIESICQHIKGFFRNGA